MGDPPTPIEVAVIGAIIIIGVVIWIGVGIWLIAEAVTHG